MTDARLLADARILEREAWARYLLAMFYPAAQAVTTIAPEMNAHTCANEWQRAVARRAHFETRGAA